MNKGLNGLTAIIQGRLGMNPIKGGIFAFCSKTFSQIKYIEWDGNGFKTHAKRLEYGRIPWPDAKLGKTLVISKRELEFLLNGATPKQYMAREDYSEKIMV